jgi:hypothetical protein
MKYFIWGLTLAWMFWAQMTAWKHYNLKYGCDAKPPYHAAQGDFTWRDSKPEYRNIPQKDFGYLYHKSAAILWKPALLFSEKTYIIINALVITVAYFFCVFRLLEVKYGWIVVLATLRSCEQLLVTGNVGILLIAFLGFLPWDMVASAIKPPLGMVALLGDIKREILGS